MVAGALAYAWYVYDQGCGLRHKPAGATGVTYHTVLLCCKDSQHRRGISAVTWAATIAVSWHDAEDTWGKHFTFVACYVFWCGWFSVAPLVGSGGAAADQVDLKTKGVG